MSRRPCSSLTTGLRGARGASIRPCYSECRRLTAGAQPASGPARTAAGLIRPAVGEQFAYPPGGQRGRGVAVAAGDGRCRRACCSARPPRLPPRPRRRTGQGARPAICAPAAAPASPRGARSPVASARKISPLPWCAVDPGPGQAEARAPGEPRAGGRVERRVGNDDRDARPGRRPRAAALGCLRVPAAAAVRPGRRRPSAAAGRRSSTAPARRPCARTAPAGTPCRCRP